MHFYFFTKNLLLENEKRIEGKTSKPNLFKMLIKAMLLQLLFQLAFLTCWLCCGGLFALVAFVVFSSILAWARQPPPDGTIQSMLIELCAMTTFLLLFIASSASFLIFLRRRSYFSILLTIVFTVGISGKHWIFWKCKNKFFNRYHCKWMNPKMNPYSLFGIKTVAIFPLKFI